MKYRNLLVAAVAASAVAGFCACAEADTIAVPDGIAVKESNIATPARGMSMDQVSSKFGTPVSKVSAVGSPPISRWEYPGFIVYFEHDHVIHSVVSDSPAPADS